MVCESHHCSWTQILTATDPSETRDLGPQPLDALMRARGFDNHALVSASPSQLTHKQVQRGRQGRRLTRNMQIKILEAWRKTSGEAAEVSELFNYRGR